MADTDEVESKRHRVHRLTPELRRLRKTVVCRCNVRDGVGGPGRERRIERAVETEWRAALAELGLRPASVFKPGANQAWRKGRDLYVQPLPASQARDL